jgi:hypothetical protein
MLADRRSEQLEQAIPQSSVAQCLVCLGWALSSFCFLTKRKTAMNQRELDRALARATGESVRTIRRLGFSLLDVDCSDLASDASELAPQIIDWDSLEADRMALAMVA